jgi:hypothetical protein
VFGEPVHSYPSARTLLGFCLAHYQFPLQHMRVTPHAADARQSDNVVDDAASSSAGSTQDGVSATAVDDAQWNAEGIQAPSGESEESDDRAHHRGAFVSYHHLLHSLEHTVLRLLEDLYGPRWHCRCATSGGTKSLCSRDGECKCNCDDTLDTIRAALHAEQMRASKRYC